VVFASDAGCQGASLHRPHGFPGDPSGSDWVSLRVLERVWLILWKGLKKLKTIAKTLRFLLSFSQSERNGTGAVFGQFYDKL